MKNNIKAFIKEIVPIIAGILIALFINNWNENRKDKKYIDQIFTSIDKELSETKEDIISKLAQQKSLLDTLDFYSKNDTISLMDAITKVKGIHMPSIKLSAWKAISNSKIELIEYDKISTLANIENQHELFIMKNENFLSFIYPNLNETTNDKKQTMKIMIMDIISTEKTIQEEIEKILND